MKKTMIPAEIVARLMGDKDNAERASLPLGIDAQEMDGQNEIITRDMMPRDLRPSREVFEKAGFVFGKQIDGLFIEAKMPDGWSKKATEHALYSEILDGHGNRRGSLFYNAAFYDRDAHGSLSCRYGLRSCDVEGDAGKCEIAVWDFSEGRALHSAGQADIRDYDRLEKLRSEASRWLEAQLPDSKDPLAYW